MDVDRVEGPLVILQAKRRGTDRVVVLWTDDDDDQIFLLCDEGGEESMLIIKGTVYELYSHTHIHTQSDLLWISNSKSTLIPSWV